MKNDILDELNEEQKRALLETEGAVLVTAGAGSGKTRLLTHRISYLIKEKNVDPYNILAITFTNKAANEMRERCVKLVDGGEKVWISTFHSMCARILRNDIEKLLGYDNNFTIYSDQDADRIYKQIFENFLIDKDDVKKNIVFHISNLKNNNMTISEYEPLYSYINNFDLVKKVYIKYQEALKNANALDFNDLLNKTYELFNTSSEVLEKYQNRFKYILVDEFQDTNKIQYDLIKLLSAKNKNIFVVGDEDQCIYTWRGANFTNIFDFQKDFSDVKTFKLERNYRSTKKILDLANKLIKNNRSRLEKRLWTENNKGIEPDARVVYDEKGEAEIVAREIYDMVNNKGYKYSDFAVLVRLNALTYPFEDKFLSYNIPHRIYGGFKFYERVEIKNVISYLRIFLNPKDEVSLLRVINFPRRGLGDRSILAIKEIAEANNLTMLETVLKIEDLGAPQGLRNKLKDFRNKYLKLLNEFELQSLYDFVLAVIREFDIRSAYETNTEENINKRFNIDNFVTSVKEFTDRNPKGTLTDFLESITLQADIDTMEDESNAVTIATIHSVKGLEFRCVFIVGLEENIFPISRAKNKEEDMEEERRLMYVAITRAKERLMLSRCKSRYLYNRREYSVDSRFLKELELSESDFDVLSANKNVNHGYIRGFNYKSNLEVNMTAEQDSKYSYRPIKQVSQRVKIEKQPTKYEEFIQSQKKEGQNRESYIIGQTVLHPKFGIGKVNKISDDFIDVNFDKLGIKTLLIDLAPLKAL